MLSSLSRSTNSIVALLMLLMIATGLSSLWAAERQRQSIEQIEAASKLIQRHMTADMMHDAIRGDVLAMLLAAKNGDPAGLRDAEADLKEHKALFFESLKANLAYQKSGPLHDKAKAAEPLMQAYVSEAEAMATAARSRPDDVESRFGTFMLRFTELEDGMAAISDTIAQTVDQVVKEASDVAALARAIVIGGIIFSVLCAIGIGYLSRRYVVQPLEQLIGAIRRMAAGDLSTELPACNRADEIGQLSVAVNSFRSQLREAEAAAERVREEQTQLICNSIGTALAELAQGNLTARVSSNLSGAYAKLKTDMNEAMAELSRLIGEVLRSSGSILSGSSEIASATSDLARRTESNAATIEQTTATLVEINGRIQRASSASKETAQRAQSVMSTVEQGRAIAADAVGVMGRVNESAKGIDTVIEGLDKIAFQTRVLAMNAAVEAGRAGEAGKGFAVVADLVSALAMRAEEEAKNARSQLVVTQTEIGAAVKAVVEVDHALSRISTDVSSVHGLLDTIVEESRSQSVAMSEITVAVQEMDQATQANAAMVEQASAAARSLTGEVHNLSDNAGRFRIAA